uniref:Two-component system, NtrC family, response regulator AtoC/two-component system, NtrC family, response regulator GlrR n=1 Tax=Candidatus Kentrum sp. DK TaxID=2126562 RepID=A0A450TAM9_9GAMM|nr:MAG: two-component system, NtrC family, response regulator AtoC/two-component system, NtrC family, response regulator GlrR [Candidatus Kentron sp. DK]
MANNTPLTAICNKNFENNNASCDNIVTMPKPKLLIVDDDPAFAAKLTGALEGLFHVDVCHSEREFHERYAMGRFALIIMDMRLEEDREGLALLKAVHAQDPQQPAIVMTAYADASSHIDAIESGALTYLDKREFSPGLIARTVEALVRQGVLHRRVAELERQLASWEPLEIIGASEAIRRVQSRLQRAADNGRAPVLLVGEPGSGRELAARNIHRMSRMRSDGPFVTAFSSRFRETEIEERLFGATRRSVNGDSSDAKGLMEEARDGVLLLNDAHALDGGTLEALSRYPETGAFRRAGGESDIGTDVQLVFSTTPTEPNDIKANDTKADPLRVMVERCGGISIVIPPLRERREDIPLLAQYMLQTLYRRGETRIRSLRETAIAIMEAFPWPGNVHELKNTVASAATRADAMGAKEIAPEHLPRRLLDSATQATSMDATIPAQDYRHHLAWAELNLVASSMETFSTTKQADLAKILGYNDRYTFARRIRRCFNAYPELDREFPKVRELFADRNGKSRP